MVTSPNRTPVDVEQKKYRTTRPIAVTTYKDYLEFQEWVSDMKFQLVKRNDLLHVFTGVDMLLGNKKKSYCDAVKTTLSGRTK